MSHDFIESPVIPGHRRASRLESVIEKGKGFKDLHARLWVFTDCQAHYQVIKTSWSMSAKKRIPLMRLVQGAGLSFLGPAGYFPGGPHRLVGKSSPRSSAKVSQIVL